MIAISASSCRCHKAVSDPVRRLLSKYLLPTILVGLFSLFPQKSRAEIELSSSMNPVGSGARAIGMGGAFIAVADDATAASWNPAGLVQLEKPEISVVYSYSNRSHSYNSSSHPELTGTTHEVDLHDINFASLAYPFTLLNRNIVISVNYQRLYDMNKTADFNYRFDLGDLDYIDNRFTTIQEGYLGVISPAIAIQVLPDLYFGAAVNIWDNFAGTCNWQFKQIISGSGSVFGSPYTESGLWTQKNTFSGLNANLGLLYTLNGTYSFGFVYKTAFTADIQRESYFYSENSLFPNPDNTPLITKEKVHIDMPASYGFGFAYRHSDNLTIALDVYRTEWSDFAETDALGNKKNPISTAPISEGKPKDTTQIRLGGEYLFIGNKIVIPVRGGFFYDPEPGRSRIDDFFGVSVGSGIAIDSWTSDVSYQYRWGNRVTGDIPQPGVSSDIQQHTVMASLIYHF